MTVNQFNRAEVVAKELERLQRLYEQDAEKNVGFITTNIRGKVSQYDPVYGELYLDSFAPGRVLNFHIDGKSRQDNKGIDVISGQMEFTNSLEAFVWKVSPEQAEAVEHVFESLLMNRRNYFARTRVQIVGASQESGTLQGKVLSYELYTDPVSSTELAVKFGEVSLEQ